MDYIYDYIRRYYSYKENECLMYYFVCGNINYTEYSIIKSLLYEYNDDNLIIKTEKNITGKVVIPFNYKNRKGDIMTYLDKFIIITLYPI
jgi:hypothetical protein